jgi:hypothetical protein
MSHAARIYLGAALLLAAALPLVLRADEDAALTPVADPLSTGGDETLGRASPCSCRDSGADREHGSPLIVVRFLHPRWSEESLRNGEDFALVYADVPGLEPDFYLLRVYASGKMALATLVDRRGSETPFEAEFDVVGKRSVRLYVDVLGLGAPTDGDSAADDPPTEQELDLLCGDDQWILIVWTNDDGSVGWDGQCCDGEC